MVSAVSSIGQNSISTEALEIIRRLQSLGIAATGNLSVDKQRLQQAELQKQQETMASNSVQNLSNLEGTDKDFSSTLNILSVSQPAPANSIGGTDTAQSSGLVMGLDAVSGTQSLNDTQKSMLAGSAKDEGGMVSADKMLGALQLAELNKLKLGLIA
ncbi:MAG: hypothetical protein LUB59_00235 [Candidatus Gastranaerophilales bacterium]|nr:hypothetical protein [Candidatus Gastranaerophilales bacterium]